MRFRFHEKKATQAAAHLLGKSGGEEYCLSVIKWLYLADRRALIEHGLPVTGARFVSMDKGPVVSEVLNLINSSTPSDVWSRFIRTEGFKVKLIASPGDDELSRYEVRILNETFAKYGHIDRWDLVEWLHKNIPEWEDPHGSSIPISYEDVLHRGEVPEARISEMMKDAEMLWQLEALGR